MVYVIIKLIFILLLFFISVTTSLVVGFFMGLQNEQVQVMRQNHYVSSQQDTLVQNMCSTKSVLIWADELVIYKVLIPESERNGFQDIKRVITLTTKELKLQSSVNMTYLWRLPQRKLFVDYNFDLSGLIRQAKRSGLVLTLINIDINQVEQELESENKIKEIHEKSVRADMGTSLESYMCTIATMKKFFEYRNLIAQTKQ